MCDQLVDVRAIDVIRRLQLNAANATANTLKKRIGILQCRTIKEEERNPARIRDKRYDYIRPLFTRPEPDSQSVVVLVNELITPGHQRAHLASRTRKCLGDLRRVVADELGEARRWCDGSHDA